MVIALKTPTKYLTLLHPLGRVFVSSVGTWVDFCDGLWIKYWTELLLGFFSFGVYLFRALNHHVRSLPPLKLPWESDHRKKCSRSLSCIESSPCRCQPHGWMNKPSGGSSPTHHLTAATRELRWAPELEAIIINYCIILATVFWDDILYSSR